MGWGLGTWPDLSVVGGVWVNVLAVVVLALASGLAVGLAVGLAAGFAAGFAAGLAVGVAPAPSETGVIRYLVALSVVWEGATYQLRSSRPVDVGRLR